MKLLLAVPCMDFMPFQFVESLIGLLHRLEVSNVCFSFKFISGTLVYVARDKLATYAIDHNYTHVLWLDSDMVFQTDLLDELTFSGHEFVAGIYQARRKPHVSCLFETLEPVKRFETYPSDTFQIEGCGFGCVLMKTEILEAVMKKYKTCFTPMEDYGEDLAFCIRAKECGYTLYAEPTAICGHVGHIVVYETDYEKAMDEIK